MPFNIVFDSINFKYLLFWWIQFLLYLLIFPFLSHAQEIGLQELSEINRENYDHVKSIEVDLTFERYQWKDSEQILNQNQMLIDGYLEHKEKNNNDPTKSESEKDAFNRSIDKLIQRAKDSKPKLHTENIYSRKFYVDFSKEKYRLEQSPADPEMKIIDIKEHLMESKKNLFPANRMEKITVASYAKDNQVFMTYTPIAKNVSIKRLGNLQNIYESGARLGVLNPKFLPGDYELMSITKSTIEEYSVLIYELQLEKKSKKIKIERIYVDPGLGYRYRRVESLIDNQMFCLREAKDYKFFNNVPLPTYHEATWFTSDPDRPIRQKDIIRIKDAKINEPLPPDIFKIDYPDDTTIYDEISGIATNKAKDIENSVSLDEIIEIGLETRFEKEIVNRTIKEDKPSSSTDSSLSNLQKNIPTKSFINDSVATAAATQNDYSSWVFVVGLVGLLSILGAMFFIFKKYH